MHSLSKFLAICRFPVIQELLSESKKEKVGDCAQCVSWVGSARLERWVTEVRPDWVRLYEVQKAQLIPSNTEKAADRLRPNPPFAEHLTLLC